MNNIQIISRRSHGEVNRRPSYQRNKDERLSLRMTGTDGPRSTRQFDHEETHYCNCFALVFRNSSCGIGR
jgi:hypothetical protein